MIRVSSALKQIPTSKKAVDEAVKKSKPVEYEYLWRNKFLATDTKSFDEFLAVMESAVQHLRNMKADGVQLREEGVGDDYATFWTTDPIIAKKYGMEKPEWEDGEDED